MQSDKNISIKSLFKNGWNKILRRFPYLPNNIFIWSEQTYNKDVSDRFNGNRVAIYNKSVEPANKESEKTNQNSPLQAAIYEIIIFPAIWLILAIYWQIINLYFIDFSSFLWHNFNIYRHEFQNSILFHDYVLLFSNLICSNKYGQKTDKY